MFVIGSATKLFYSVQFGKARKKKGKKNSSQFTTTLLFFKLSIKMKVSLVHLLHLELRSIFSQTSLTVGNWPYLVTAAFRVVDKQLEQGFVGEGNARQSIIVPQLLTSPTGTTSSRTPTKRRSLFDAGLKRLSINQRDTYIIPILKGILRFLEDPPESVDEQVTAFLLHLFRASGAAVIEVIGEAYYNKDLLGVHRRASIHTFEQKQAEVVFEHLKLDTMGKHITMQTWPLLISVAKAFTDKCFPETSIPARFQIIHESLCHFLKHPTPKQDPHPGCSCRERCHRCLQR